MSVKIHFFLLCYTSLQLNFNKLTQPRMQTSSTLRLLCNKQMMVTTSRNQKKADQKPLQQYLNKYIRCFLKAQQRRVGSEKGSLLSLTFAAAEGIFLTFLLLLSPWYKAIFKNLSLFSTFPRIRATLLVCKFTI